MSAISGSRAIPTSIVVAPCTADFLAQMAHGLADDLAVAVLLATDRPVLIAPAMNPHMWKHPATQRNLARSRRRHRHHRSERRRDGGERRGRDRAHGRAARDRRRGRWRCSAGRSEQPLAGKRVLVTAGPTHEPIDPVRYIANRSSGKQGYAIARAAADAGAQVTLVSRAGERCPIRPASTSCASKAHATCWPRSRRRCRRTSRFSPPRSPTGASPAKATRRSRKARRPSRRWRSSKTRTFSSTIAHRAKAGPKLVIGFAAETENVIEQRAGQARPQGLRLDPGQ